MKKLGEVVKKGDPLAVIFSNGCRPLASGSERRWKKTEEAFPMVGNAFELGGSFESRPLVCEVIG